jgi:tRNA 2-thiouridine synthesizing protein D
LAATINFKKVSTLKTPQLAGAFFYVTLPTYVIFHAKIMSSFTLIVTSAPFSQQNAYSAYRFALATVQSNHSINGIFFYQGGALNGSSLQITPSDEFDLYAAWKKLSQEYQVPLMVCVSAASKRGITTAEDARESDNPHFSLAAPFTSVGLGELAILISSSDRLIQF